MTDIVWEDSRARHLLHQIINCVQALGGYAELGEFDKAIAISFECVSNIKQLRTELEKMRDDIHET